MQNELKILPFDLSSTRVGRAAMNEAVVHEHHVPGLHTHEHLVRVGPVSGIRIDRHRLDVATCAAKHPSHSISEEKRAPYRWPVERIVTRDDTQRSKFVREILQIPDRVDATRCFVMPPGQVGVAVAMES